MQTISKIMIVKCLNRITTETELSAAHIVHFLLGHSDSKTSHLFTKLNLYTGLAWLTRESKKDDAPLEDVPLTDLLICEKTIKILMRIQILIMMMIM